MIGVPGVMLHVPRLDLLAAYASTKDEELNDDPEVDVPPVTDSAVMRIGGKPMRPWTPLKSTAGEQSITPPKKTILKRSKEEVTAERLANLKRGREAKKEGK